MRLGIISFFWLALFLIFQRTDLSKYIEYQFAQRLEFYSRDQLGKSPTLDRKIKIFAYDDLSIAAFKSAEISLGDWTLMLKAIGDRKPRAILIDKIFGYISPSEERDLPKFVNELKTQKNTILSCFLQSAVLPQRPLLDLERPEYSLDAQQLENSDALNWLSIVNKNAYGPLPEIAEAAPAIGQILYPGLGRVYPWVRVSQNRAIPHASLLTSDNLTMDARGSRINGEVLPVDNSGMLPINFTSVKKYYSNASSMRSLMARARASTPITDINEGDIVILLPLMYTGNIDLIETPMGRIPGGFIHVSIINSMLKDEWLKPKFDSNLTVVFASLSGIAIALIAEPLSFWVAFLAFQLIYILGALGAFAYFGWVLPWIYPCMAMTCNALSIHAIRSVELRKETRRLKSALTGLLPSNKLKELLAGNSHIVGKPCERVVTVMFLDISNFSSTSQMRTPEEVFNFLKEIMGHITMLVHKHGGTVDRSLGDGLLCFFGYSYDGRVDEKHVDAAIACAIEIQRENVVRCINQKDSQNPIWPFRIGLNTTAAFIGDLGNQDRMDFTLIGNGVNLAQRLEAACNHHSILVSLTTFDLSNRFNINSAGVNRCKINVKNQTALLECIEIDPLSDMEAQKQTANKAFRERLGLNRSEERWPVSKEGPIEFKSSFGKTHLVDFSRAGCCIGLNELLARGLHFSVELSSHDEVLEQKIRSLRLSNFRAVVRWSRPHDQGFIHGVQYVDINDSQRLEFFELLRLVNSAH
ncbi:MAG: CHASE2 domain-containing protein [Proteobacteria bacterium]|nr:CHASE2 domain-containing protein [Pseudomonadota bacterium]